MNKPSMLIAVVVAGFFFVGAHYAAAATTCSFRTSGKAVYLNADCTSDATIFIPDGFTLYGRDHTITAIDPVGDQFKGAILQNAPGAVSVQIRDVKLTTSALTSPATCHSGDDKLRGIALLNSSGSIRDVNISNLRHTTPTCSEGSGVIVNATPFDGTHPATKRVVIDDVHVSDFQYIGIQVQGDVLARVEDSTVRGGAAAAAAPVGQFAIVSGRGALSTISQNSVKMDPASNSNSIGLLLIEGSNNVVEGNRIDGTPLGVFVESFCQNAPSANQNRIIGNRVAATTEGIVLVARTQSGVSTCSAHVDQNLVAGNLLKAQSGSTTIAAGVYVGTQDFGGGFTPVADGNMVKYNRIDGFQPAIFQTGTDTNTVIQGNFITP